MTKVADQEVVISDHGIVGVYTHQNEHVAVAFDGQGIRLAKIQTPATIWRSGELEGWARNLGEIRRGLRLEA